MQELTVVKIGGNVLDKEEALDAFLQDFAVLQGPKILVHGGGKLATELSAKLGIETNMVDGRRVTGEATIRIVTMVYAGFINKSVVAALQVKGCNAIGLSGADARLLPAVKRPVKEVDYGLVGDIHASEVNVALLRQLLHAGITPVIAPISCNAEGQLLNINADTVAKTIAAAFGTSYVTTLIYCFEKNGLLRNVADEQSVIAEIDVQSAEAMKTDGSINKGMVPKIDNAFDAIKNGVSAVYIGHANHILQMKNRTAGFGTCIKA